MFLKGRAEYRPYGGDIQGHFHPFDTGKIDLPRSVQIQPDTVGSFIENSFIEELATH
jgi:hypothetical protein